MIVTNKLIVTNKIILAFIERIGKLLPIYIKAKNLLLSCVKPAALPLHGASQVIRSPLRVAIAKLATA